jgi:hypothetical protein
LPDRDIDSAKRVDRPRIVVGFATLFSSVRHGSFRVPAAPNLPDTPAYGISGPADRAAFSVHHFSTPEF